MLIEGSVALPWRKESQKDVGQLLFETIGVGQGARNRAWPFTCNDMLDGKIPENERGRSETIDKKFWQSSQREAFS